MATAGVSSPRRTNPRRVVALLSSAVCEWFLLFFLFVDAAFSHLLIKFAQYCELPTPCMFCSKIGYSFGPFGTRKNESYGRFLCRDHIDEISSLVSCHVHGNLADVQWFCEECFMPFSMQNKLNSETYRLLVGKLGLDVERQGGKSVVLHRKLLASCSGIRICTCCSKPWGESSSPSIPNVKPPRAPGRSHREKGKKSKGRHSGMGRSERKLHSDSESEVPLSDSDDGGSALQGRNDAKESRDARNVERSRCEVEMDNAAFGKQNEQALNDATSLMEQAMHLEDVGRHCNMNTLYTSSECGSEELNSIKPFPKAKSLGDVSQAHEAVEPRPHMSSLPPEHVSDNIPASSSAMGSPKKSYSHHEGNTFPPPEHSVNGLEVSGDDMLRGKSPINSAARVDDQREVSVEPVERVEDVKPLPQKGDASLPDEVHIQMAASLERIDPGHEYLDEFDIDEIEGENTVDRLKKKVEFDQRFMSALYKELEEERNASAIAANQAMNMINKLQEEKAALHMEAMQYLRMMDEQTEYDMEALERANDLLSEKEKEVQDLEADLDFYRLNFPEGEEGTDSRKEIEDSRVIREALEKANDLLSLKEKEVQDLEAELEVYKTNFPEGGQKGEVIGDSGVIRKALEKANHLLSLKEKEVEDLKAELEFYRTKFPGGERESKVTSGAIHAESGSSASSHRESSEISKSSDILENTNVLASTLEEEELCLIEWLVNLERRIQEASSTGACNGEHVKEPNKVDHQEDLPTEGGDQTHHKGEMENGPTQDYSTDSVEDSNIVAGENNHVSDKDGKLSGSGGRISLSNLRDEIENFSDRLQALETDRDFINHAFSALQHGDDGLHVIQEIVNHLQELRNFEFQRRGLSVT